jgi:hypothetical protein
MKKTLVGLRIRFPHLGGTLLPMGIERNDVVGLGRVNVASSKNQRQVRRSCSDISSKRKKARCIKTTETFSNQWLQ